VSDHIYKTEIHFMHVILFRHNGNITIRIYYQ